MEIKDDTKGTQDGSTATISLNGSIERPKSNLVGTRRELFGDFVQKCVLTPKNVEYIITPIKNTSLEKSRKNLWAYDLTAAFCAIWSVLFSIIDSAIFFENDKESDGSNIGFRTCATIMSLLVVLFVVFRYLAHIQILRQQSVIKFKEDLGSTGLYKWLILEIIICLLHCPAGVDTLFTKSQLGHDTEYAVWDLLSALCVLKLYLIYRVFYALSRYSKDIPLRVLKVFGVVKTQLFAFKAYFREKTEQWACITLVFLTLIAAYIYYLSERNDIENADDDPQYADAQIENYYDALWLIMMTELVTGYGDFYPATHPGRFWVWLSAMVGPFLIACFVFVVYKNLIFRREEFLAYSWIYKTEQFSESRKCAMNAIKAALSIHIINWKQKRLDGDSTHPFRHEIFKDVYVKSALFPRVPVTDGNWISLEDRSHLTTVDLYKKVQYWTELKENLRDMRQHKIRAVSLLEDDAGLIQGLTEAVNSEFSKNMFAMKYMSGFMTQYMVYDIMSKQVTLQQLSKKSKQLSGSITEMLKAMDKDLLNKLQVKIERKPVIITPRKIKLEPKSASVSVKTPVPPQVDPISSQSDADDLPAETPKFEERKRLPTPAQGIEELVVDQQPETVKLIDLSDDEKEQKEEVVEKPPSAIPTPAQESIKSTHTPARKTPTPESVKPETPPDTSNVLVSKRLAAALQDETIAIDPTKTEESAPPKAPTPEPVAAPPKTPTPEPVAAPPKTPTPEPVAAPPKTPTPEPVAAPPKTPTPEPVAVLPKTPTPEPVAALPKTPTPEQTITKDLTPQLSVNQISREPTPAPGAPIDPEADSDQTLNALMPKSATPQPFADQVLREGTPTPGAPFYMEEGVEQPIFEVEQAEGTEAIPAKTPTPEPVVAEAPPKTPTPEPVLVEAPPKTPTPEPVVAEALPKTPTPEPVVSEVPPKTPTPEPVVAEAPPKTPTPEPVVAEAPPKTPSPEPIISKDLTPQLSVNLISRQQTPVPGASMNDDEGPEQTLNTAIPKSSLTPMPSTDQVLREQTPEPGAPLYTEEAVEQPEMPAIEQEVPVETPQQPVVEPPAVETVTAPKIEEKTVEEIVPDLELVAPVAAKKGIGAAAEPKKPKEEIKKPVEQKKGPPAKTPATKPDPKQPAKAPVKKEEQKKAAEAKAPAKQAAPKQPPPKKVEERKATVKAPSQKPQEAKAQVKKEPQPKSEEAKAPVKAPEPKQAPAQPAKAQKKEAPPKAAQKPAPAKKEPAPKKQPASPRRQKTETKQTPAQAKKAAAKPAEQKPTKAPEKAVEPAKPEPPKEEPQPPQEIVEMEVAKAEEAAPVEIPAEPAPVVPEEPPKEEEVAPTEPEDPVQYINDPNRRTTPEPSSYGPSDDIPSVPVNLGRQTPAMLTPEPSKPELIQQYNDPNRTTTPEPKASTQVVNVPSTASLGQDLRAETPAPPTPDIPKVQVAKQAPPEPKMAFQDSPPQAAKEAAPARKPTPPRTVTTPYGNKKVTPAPQKPQRKQPEPPKPAKKAPPAKVEPKKPAPAKAEPKKPAPAMTKKPTISHRQQPTRTSDEMQKITSPNSKGSSQYRKSGSKVFPLPPSDPNPPPSSAVMTPKVVPAAVEEVKVIKKAEEPEDAFVQVPKAPTPDPAKFEGKPYQEKPKPFMDLYKMPRKFEKRMTRHYNPGAADKKSYWSAKRLYDLANKDQADQSKSTLSPERSVMRQLPTYYKDHLTSAIEKEQVKLDRFKQSSGPTVQEEMKDVRKEMLSKHANLIGKLDSINDTLKKLLK